MSSIFETATRDATNANTMFREVLCFVASARSSTWIGNFGETANMDREVFLNHLLLASDRCREFTTRFVVDSLSSTFAFWVILNSSYDRNPLRDDETVFPDDVRIHGKRVGPLTADAVASLLWRDRIVPEWIDISMWEADENATYF